MAPEITFHTVGHWKGTIEYHKTKVVPHAKEVLGHKNVSDATIHVNLEGIVVREANNEFSVGTVDNLKGACKITEMGPKFVSDRKDKKDLRKAKAKMHKVQLKTAYVSLEPFVGEDPFATPFFHYECNRDDDGAKHDAGATAKQFPQLAVASEEAEKTIVGLSRERSG